MRCRGQGTLVLLCGALVRLRNRGAHLCVRFDAGGETAVANGKGMQGPGGMSATTATNKDVSQQQHHESLCLTHVVVQVVLSQTVSCNGNANMGL